MHLSRHKQKRTQQRSTPSQPGSSNEFTPVRRVQFRGGNRGRRPGRPRETQPYKSSSRTPNLSNPFSLTVESDSNESDTEVHPEPNVVNPITMLEPWKQKKQYPVETLEGLLLLGMIQIPELEDSVKRVLNEYTDKCKKIHQQYMNTHKRGHRGKQPRRHPHPKSRKQELTGEDFAAIRDFKKTELKRDKEGVAKTKSKIRANLNKLTDKTYSKIHVQIKEEVNELIREGANEEDYIELSRFIFDVASGNQFYGNLYADLFNELVNDYEFLKDAMNKQLGEFVKSMIHVETACPDTEYDKFCEINKKNELRRSLAGFMGHLLRVSCIDGDTIGNAIYGLITQSIEWIRMKEGTMKENKVCVEEMGEVVYAFLKASGVNALDLNLWEPIFKNCLAIAEMKRDKQLSLTAKAKFKYMDIIDLIKNWKID